MQQTIPGVNYAHIKSKILIGEGYICRLFLGGSMLLISDLCETGEIPYVLFLLLFCCRY